MNAQELEYVRIQLRAALLEETRSLKGQLEAFAERPLAEQKRYPRQQSHMIEFNDGTGGVLQVETDKAAMYVLETRNRRCPLPPISDRAFAAAPWRRAINLLSDYKQAWLRYCYGFDLTFSYQTLICRVVWDAHQKHLPLGLLNKTKKRIISLIWLAAQEVAAVRQNTTYKEYAGAALARLMSVKPCTWLRVYAPHWRLLKAAFNEMDQSALVEVLLRHSEVQSEKVI